MNGAGTISGATDVAAPSATSSENFLQPFAIPSSSTKFQSFDASAISSSLTLNLLPLSDYATADILANCARQAQQLKQTRHTRRLAPR
ncbi:unnamed protein product [Thelazia callipaeda]|uniref:OAR domain-containing protein n=1 Tax=Thelazia callipaeda TaxID=103827 RepID=A0A0N5DCC6_THECL|nr:unnamed protein product [Thelazia callipaeda]